MTIPESSVHADSVQGMAELVLFVEGGRVDSSTNTNRSEPIDQEALSIFFQDMIEVQALGPSFYVSSAAEALHHYHPNYYFLIDRDHQTEAEVRQSWDNFPDPNTYNLLIWPKREFESYFIEPEYLRHSRFLKVSQTELERRVVEACGKRLFFDAANQVIASVREDLKKTGIKQFKKVSEFPTKVAALERLQSRDEFQNHKDSVLRSLDNTQIKERFESVLDEWSGGADELKYGQGVWIARIGAKKILSEIIPTCFKVKGGDGKPVQGDNAVRILIKDLITRPLENQPQDFQNLHRLIEKQLN